MAQFLKNLSWSQIVLFSSTVTLASIVYAAFRLRGLYSRIKRIKAYDNHPKDSDALRIGIVGATDLAATVLIYPARKVRQVIVGGVCARDTKKAQIFAKQYEIPKVYNTYEEMLSDNTIDAIYIPSPTSLHFEYTRKAILAKKHVLCEKPIASNAKEAEEIFKMTQDSNIKVVEAFHYRHHPSVIRMKEIIENGEIGPVTHIYSKINLPFFMCPKPTDNSANFDLSGGVLTYAGCYAVHGLRYLTGMEPTVMNSQAKSFDHDKRVEKYIYSQVHFKNGSTGIIEASFSKILNFDATVIVVGEKGEVEMTGVFGPHFGHTITIVSNGKKRTEKHYGNGGTSYEYQLRAFVEEVKGGPKCSHKPDDYVLNMKLIDSMLEKANLPFRGKPHYD